MYWKIRVVEGFFYVLCAAEYLSYFKDLSIDCIHSVFSEMLRSDFIILS